MLYATKVGDNFRCGLNMKVALILALRTIKQPGYWGIEIVGYEGQNPRMGTLQATILKKHGELTIDTHGPDGCVDVVEYFQKHFPDVDFSSVAKQLAA